MRPDPSPSVRAGAVIVLAVVEVVDETIIAAIHGSRANHAGNFERDLAVGMHNVLAGREWGIAMPKGRSTFAKRQKEHTRQQRQRDKAERRNQRKQERPAEGSIDEMAELRAHAAEQAALFNVGREEADTEESIPRNRIGGDS